MHPFDLTLVPPRQRDAVECALSAGDVAAAMRYAPRYAPRYAGVRFVAANITALKQRGLYERALLGSYLAGGYVGVSPARLRDLFDQCDPAALRSMSAPLPDHHAVTLFRGVHNSTPCEPVEYVRGVSWTTLLGLACYFAAHGDPATVPNRRPADVAAEPFRESFPFVAVYRAEVATADVLYRGHDLGGDAEWVVTNTRPQRMDLTRADVFEAARDWLLSAHNHTAQKVP